MSKKPVFAITLTLVLVGILGVALKVERVEASGTITINADGSVEGTTHITSVDNVTYTFTDNILNQSIIVERDNVIIDGAGYTLQGTGVDYSTGIYLSGRSNVTIKNTNIKNFDYGIVFSEYPSYTSTIAGNNITANNRVGIAVYYSSNNILTGNNISNNGDGIWLSDSSNNSIAGNNIANNNYGIYLYSSSNNFVYHNNFINNTEQVYSSESTNTWDDSAGKGNYWSDYEERYPYATEIDGIWDTPYVIDEYNQDNYPLVPEFPTWTSLLLILTVLTVAITIYKRRRLKTPTH